MVLPAPSACRGSRLIATRANGCPAFGQYKPDPAGGYEPWALQVVEVSGGKVSELALFLHPLNPERLFPSFGLPLHLDR
jgi:RNA polymerase sigma-70 factor (ECF subfamily)